MENKKLVLFDFDGVLVNTNEVCFVANSKTNPEMTREEYAAMSHGNFHEIAEQIPFTLNPTFHSEYGEGLQCLTILDILEGAIRNFKNKYIMAIITSGSEPVIKKFLEKEKIANSFVDVLGYETHKKKTVKFQLILEKYHFKPEDALFITDTLGDIREANESGIKSIGVTWGLHDRETLEKGNPWKIIDNPALLESSIKESFY